MALAPELVKLVRTHVEEREKATDPEGLRRVLRVEIESQDHYSHRAHPAGKPQLEMVVDEPKERGGKDLGPAPLAYFLTGVGTCFLNQLVSVSIAQGIDIRLQRMQVKGEFQRQVGGGFQHITQELFLDGDASEDVMQGLTEKAEAFCFIHNTLRNAVKMTTLIHLNGKEVVRRTSDPEALAGR